MRYHIRLASEDKQKIEVKAVFEVKEASFKLWLPYWRPGRYHPAGYHKKVSDLKFIQGEKEITIGEMSSNWVQLEGFEPKKEAEVCFTFDASEVNAGSTFVINGMALINPINFFFYRDLPTDDQYSLSWDGFEAYQNSSTLELAEDNATIEMDYYDLIDRPILFGKELKSRQFSASNTHFSAVFAGISGDVPEKLAEDFIAYTRSQVKLFGNFPVREYQYLVFCPKDRFYHGVEHGDNTVIGLGPSEDVFGERYDDLLGVSSHELFHAWNVCRIRPVEMQPYVFNQPLRFTTGWVMEGITTYFGDVMLHTSGVKDTDWWLKEISTLMTRSKGNPAVGQISLNDSSRQLWEKGYGSVSPSEVLSIYVEGGLFTFLIDMLIIRKHDGRRSFDDVLKEMWKRFGRTERGYTESEMVEIIQHFVGKEVAVAQYLRDNIDFNEEIRPILADFGLAVEEGEGENELVCKLAEGGNRRWRERLFREAR